MGHLCVASTIRSRARAPCHRCRGASTPGRDSTPGSTAAAAASAARRGGSAACYCWIRTRARAGQQCEQRDTRLSILRDDGENYACRWVGPTPAAPIICQHDALLRISAQQIQCRRLICYCSYRCWCPRTQISTSLGRSSGHPTFVPGPLPYLLVTCCVATFHDAASVTRCPFVSLNAITRLGCVAKAGVSRFPARGDGRRHARPFCFSVVSVGLRFFGLVIGAYAHA
jgi:hypothetical protein